MNKLYIACLSLLFSAFLLTPAAVAAGDARAKTEELISAFKSVKSGKSLSGAQLKQNSGKFKKIDQLIERERIVSETIAPQKGKLTPKELAEFKSLFWATLRNTAYPASGEFFQRAKIQVGATQTKAGQKNVTVHAELSEEDVETDITFHWRSVAGKLRLVDVSFDGASLVLDYKNQFGRIVAKKGGAGLVQLLRDKYKESLKTRVTDEPPL